MINLLFLNFTDEIKNKIKFVLGNTQFKKATQYESNFIAMSKNELYWNKLDIILCFGNPSDHLNKAIFTDIIGNIPILFIAEEEIQYGERPSFMSNYPNYLPLKEITSFVLEKTMYNTIEKHKIKKRLIEVKELKKELKIKEEKYRNSFHNSPVGMFEVDADGNFVLVNKAFLNIVGFNSITELKELNVFQHGLSTNGTGELLKQRLVDEEMISNYEDKWIRADKKEIDVKHTLISIKDSLGEIEFYQGVVENITDRKFVESELIKSKRDAEKSDQLKSEFLTQISHEIRTPVNTLLSFANYIEDELSDSISEELKDSFSSMNRAGKRIIRTIDLLVKMSELHTDNYEPEFRENNLFDVIDELITLYKPIAERKNLELQFIKAIDSANFVFDRLTVYDVISHLIDNAIKYTKTGSVKIYVKYSLMNKISVTVLDTGIGISEKYIKDIFQPFSQETGGYTRKFDGNGLGLALVKEYCSLNHAEIFVSSEKNGGSNFTVVFK